ncbi:MAG TPA: stage III sporulation protein AF [Virgibacillus sp.]|nr:stage III sporulation protein AF [Virgibacillus sp.]
MDAIMDWIKQIVMFILLASIIDLMIPHSKFSKYVRLVIGFIFILIFMNPLFKLFGTDLTSQINQITDKIYESASDDKMKKSVQLKKSEIQSQQEAYVLEKMDVQLKEKVQADLQKKLNVQINKLDFSFKKEMEWTPENLKQIDVYLEKADRRSSNEEKGVVNEIDKVEIMNKENEEKQEKPNIEKVKQLLTKKWGIEKDELTIYWEGSEE